MLHHLPEDVEEASEKHALENDELDLEDSIAELGQLLFAMALVLHKISQIIHFPSTRINRKR